MLKSGWANIKAMDGSIIPTTTMQPGDYVFGDWSVTKSDIINFTHFYRADGTLVPLIEGKLFKVSVSFSNMTITNETEQQTPPPSPAPDPAGVKRIVDSVITYETEAGEIKTVRLVPAE